MKQYITFSNLGLAFLALLAPIKMMMLTVFVLAISDLITGVAAALKCNEPITSSKLRRTVSKLIIFQTGLIATFFVQQYIINNSMDLVQYVAGLIGLVELKSIFENIEKAYGQPIFKNLIKLLGSKNDIEK